MSGPLATLLTAGAGLTLLAAVWGGVQILWLRRRGAAEDYEDALARGGCGGCAHRCDARGCDD